MRVGLLLSTGALAAQAGLGLPLGWLLVHVVTAGALVGWMLLMARQHRTSCLALFLGQFIAAVILAVGEYLVLQPYLPDQDAGGWIGGMTAVGLVLLGIIFLGFTFSRSFWILLRWLIPKRWTALRSAVARAVTALTLALLVAGFLGNDGSNLRQDYQRAIGAWPVAAFIGSLVPLFAIWLWLTLAGQTANGVPGYLLELRGDDDTADSLQAAELNRWLPFRLLTLEVIILLGVGVTTGWVLWQWMS